MSRERIINLPNGLTLSRFVSAPLFLALVLRMDDAGSAGAAQGALAILIITLLTDMFDGVVARWQHQVTDFGKIMDPVADSAFFLTALFAFSASSRFGVSIWIPIIVLYREIAMHVLRRYAALAGIVLAAKTSGKLKMLVQSVIMVTLLLLICLVDSGRIQLEVNFWVYWSMIVIAAVNILSLPEYLRDIPAIVQARNEAFGPSTEEKPEHGPAPDPGNSVSEP